VKHEITENNDEHYLLRLARLRADTSGLKGSAAHPANRGTKRKNVVALRGVPVRAKGPPRTRDGRPQGRDYRTFERLKQKRWARFTPARSAKAEVPQLYCQCLESAGQLSEFLGLFRIT